MDYRDVEELEEINFPWLIFRLNENLYTVSSKFITSIVIKPEEITFVPNVSNYIIGLIHLRGNVVPLISLKRLFNIDVNSEEPENHRRKNNEMVIVLERDNLFVGLVVDEVVSVEDIVSFEETEEIRRVYKDSFIKGVAKSQNNIDILLILDEEKIMNAA
jgi:purine-binding chemotaxis protein CheW